MAVVLIEGFDNLSASLFTSKGWSAVFSSVVTGRYPAPGGAAASQAVQLFSPNTTPLNTKTLPSSYTTLVGGVAVMFDGPVGLSSGRGVVTFQTSTNAIVAAVSRSVAGLLQVSNSASSIIATGTTVTNINTWYYIELKVVVNGASGTCELHLDGNTEIASTTGNFGTTAINRLNLAAAQSTHVSWDDIYCCDTSGSAPQNTFLGPSRVVTPLPTAAGNYSQWTPNGATPNYACVDDAPPDGDTTYVSSGTVGQLDSYTFGQIDGGATCFAVQTNHYARKDDANTRQIAPLIRQAGTDYVGNTFTEAATYTDFTQIYNQDPTGANWTAAVFNADEFGVKEIA